MSLIAHAALLLSAVAVPAQQLADVASVTVAPPRTEQLEAGRKVVRDVTLSNTLASYTLRYDILELKDDPEHISSTKWAITIGYVPLGLAAPSMACWYNQGFFMWTFDGEGIEDCPATFRVVHEFGQDAMVEYSWDTPQVTATARFALTAGSDKLLMFGSYEPKVEVTESKLRLMCYPSTFDKPWVRRATTSQRTLTEGGGIELDLEQERWVLFEDLAEGRAGAGSGGLLIGDPSAFSRATIDAGGYAEYANLTLAPDQRSFALGFYEFPDMPDPLETRDYFMRHGDAEAEGLAELASADLDQPLTPLPSDGDRVAKIAERDAVKFERPSELWRPDPEPLTYPWAAKLPGEPVKVALLCGRWCAWETMELARRLEMDVDHLYFDNSKSLSSPGNWPYRSQTGIGPLGAGVAERQAVRICGGQDRDVILVAGLDSIAIPRRVREVILEEVRAGKGLVLTGDDAMLKEWPTELTADPDDSLVEPILQSLPWDEIPGLRPGERGRLGDGPPLAGYRFGEGRVLIFRAKLGNYSSLVPLSDAIEGLDGALDRTLALHAKVMLAAAGRELPSEPRLSLEENALTAGVEGALSLDVDAPEGARVSVRIEDDHGNLVEVRTTSPDEPVPVTGLAGGRSYFVDAIIFSEADECLGYTSVRVPVEGDARIASVRLSPATRNHPAAPQVVSLVDGGKLTCAVELEGIEGLQDAKVWCLVTDCLDRALASGEAPVQGETVEVELDLTPPVTVAHKVGVWLIDSGQAMAVHSEPFTVPLPYPYDDFTFLMWTYAGGEPSLRQTDRLCYEMGAEVNDLCHVGGYADEAAAREYAVSAASGMRLIPYVTRIAGSAGDGIRHPCLHDPAWLERVSTSVQNTSRQAAPYAPAAYTLGDENYLSRHQETDICTSEHTVGAFQAWLQDRYGAVEALNAAWTSEYGAFADITEPMTIDEAAEQTGSFAPWVDFRLFMDTAFAEAHDSIAEALREVDPGAKVGWDGLLGYHWLAGYDFHKLSRNLELNQVYTSGWPQDEFVRSFARPDAFTGQWGNSIADNEEGFAAVPWHNIFSGHNSCWWWTSWGCDYIPFNPDLSTSKFGEWHFTGADEVRSGPGKLLVNARRENSGIAVLYNQADMFAAKLADKLSPGQPYAGDRAWLDNHKGLLRAIQDLGLQFDYVAATELHQHGADALDGYRALFLPLATCISDEHIAAIEAFAQAGGVVVADARAGILTGSGSIRDDRPFDDLFGVQSGSGLAAFTASMPGAEDAPELTTNTIGRGRAHLMNRPFRDYGGVRHTEDRDAYLARLAAALPEAGFPRPCGLTCEGTLPKCVEQVLLTDGNLRYLCLEQDILIRGLAAQVCTLTLPEPSIVYDLRAGKQVGDGPVSEWEVEVSRGTPLVLALLPYEVTGLAAEAPGAAKLGEVLDVETQVAVSEGQPGRHVVYMSVYAPQEDRPHRQYSRSIECPGGTGSARIPFALTDPTGEWRLVFKDTASGATTEKVVSVAR